MSDDGTQISFHIRMGTFSRFIKGVLVTLFVSSILSILGYTYVTSLQRHFAGDAPMNLGDILVPGVLLSAGVLALLNLVCGTVLTLVGSIRIVIGEIDSRVSVGIGPVMWTRRFATQEFRGVAIGESFWRTRTTTHELIVLTADRTIRFGAMLPNDRRSWLQESLKKILKTTDQRERIALVP